MSRVLLVSASPELGHEVFEASGGSSIQIPLWPLPSEPGDVLKELGPKLLPDVVIIDPGISVEQGLTLAQHFDEQYPAIAILLVSDIGPEIGIAAMRAGVRDILHPAADAAEIRLVLERVQQAVAVRSTVAASPQPAPPPSSGGPQVKRGTVISVTSPKGGVGKTTVATNLAVGLAQTAPNSTVIIDLDVQFGDVASALNLSPEYTLPDIVEASVSRDSMVLKTFLTLHPTGLYAICGSPDPAAADGVTPEALSDLIQTLATDFQWVVIDTAPGMTHHTLTALDHSNELILVASMDVPAVRGLRKELDTLQDLGMFADHRHLVLNFADSNGGLTVGDIETAIGASIDLTLPRSKGVTASVNRGVPLLQAGGRDPMVKQLRKLVERFAASVPTQGGSWRRRGKHRREEFEENP